MVLDIPVSKYKTMFVPAKPCLEDKNDQVNNNNYYYYHKKDNAVTIDSSNVILLHCRLPLPQTR